MKRVVHLNEVVTAYMTSEFCKAMGQNFIRPPVMHTNAITKTAISASVLRFISLLKAMKTRAII